MWAVFAIYVLAMAWNVVVLGVTTYVVFWKDASGWWFLLAVILLTDFDTTNEMAAKVSH